MDVTKEFVLMCQKAVGIQEIFQDKLKTPLDWEYNTIAVSWKKKELSGLMGVIVHREPCYGMSYDDGEWMIYNGKLDNRHLKTQLKIEDSLAKVIWLPQLPHLQTIWLQDNPRSKFNETNYKILMDKYFLLTEYADVQEYNKVETMAEPTLEKLWLIIVMKEKFSKRWTGTIWEKI